MPVKCFVFDLDDVLLPTTSLFQQPHVRQRLQNIRTLTTPATINQLYQSFIHPDMCLIQCLHNIQAPKFIITNASRNHARASLNALCIAQYFQAQLDADSHMPLKPHKQMYEAMHNHILQALPNQSLQIIFFDDKIENLIEPRLLNWVTVWICGNQTPNHGVVPSFIMYVFPTVHEALQFFHQRP